MIRGLLATSLLMTVLSCTTGAPDLAMNAETTTIFTGATIAAGASQTPLRDHSVVTADGRILEVGPAAEMRGRYPRAAVVDLTGSTLLPGLIDAHGHLYNLGLSLDTIKLAGTTSYEEVVGKVKARAAQAAPGEWILGRGWDQNHWPQKDFPTRSALDAAISDHPVWLRRIDGHAGLANSAALRAAGVTRATADPAGGRILRDASGEPSGVLIDAAQALVDHAVPPADFNLRKTRIANAAMMIAASGLVEMHDAGADEETIRAVRELIDEGRFPIRLYTMVSDEPSAIATWFQRGPLLDYGQRLTVRSVKVYADGALGSRGAALLEPYSDDPGNRGLVIATPEHIEDVARRALAAGFQVNTHAIGDRGVRNILDAYEKAGVDATVRFRIEHLQVVAPSDFARLAHDGIIASMQPTHATSDMGWAAQRLGPERIRGAYAWRSVLENGGRLAFGSDFPIEDVNPFFGIHAAVTRQDHKGQPGGGWYPEQKLTLAEALRGFTSDAAYAAFEEKSRGTIEAGKLADFTVVDGDFFATPPGALWSAKVRMTIVGGKTVWSR